MALGLKAGLCAGVVAFVLFAIAPDLFLECALFHYYMGAWINELSSLFFVQI